MSEDTVALMVGLGFLVLVGAMTFAALHLGERQRLNAIERVHQQTLEAAKQMQWKVEQQEGRE